MTVEDLFSQPLSDILRASASREPTPGGGSVSAVTAAFAASMVAMVANLTIGNKKYRDVEDEVTDIRNRAMALLSQAEELVQTDMVAFRRFMEAYKMPSDTAELKEQKEMAIQEAVRGATEAPLQIARTCLEILELTVEIVPIGNKMAVSDAGVAAYLGEAALGAALLNVDVNLPLVKDKSFAENVTKEKEALKKKAASLKERALFTVLSRMGS
jgi:formiminotetrahydrofolate cyclodeaminase